MTNPVPRRAPPEIVKAGPAFWRQLLNGVYLLWDKLNREQLEIGEATIYTLTGTPQNNQSGNVGDIALRTDGGTGTTLYVKESGAGTTTGWVAK